MVFYSPTEELSSAIIQIRKQKDGLLKDYYSIRYSSETSTLKFDAYDPKTYLVIGNTTNMKVEELESFELFRNSLKDIEIIPFDEIIKKLELIVENLKK